MKFIAKRECRSCRCGGVARTLVWKTEEDADAFAIGGLEIAAFAQETFPRAIDELHRQLRAGRGREIVNQLGFVRDLAKTALASRAPGSARASGSLSVR